MWWLAAWKVAKKIPWQVYACAGFLLYTFIVWQWAQHYVYKDWNASTEKGRAIVDQLKKDAKKVNTVIDTQWKERTEYIYVKGDTIVKEIPKYIPIGTPDLPGGFRVLHDAAATSTVPGPASSVEATPIGVEDATKTIVTNYTQCLIWREEAVTWRQWYQEQSLLWKFASGK